MNDSSKPDSPQARTQAFLHLLPPLLDAIIPGYSVLASYLAEAVGIDISFCVFSCTLVLGLWTALRVTIIPFIEPLMRLCSSTIIIDEDDESYDQVLGWARAQPFMQGLRTVQLRNQYTSQDYDHDFGHNDPAPEYFDTTVFNFITWVARTPLTYDPYSSSGLFLHKRYLFRLTRERLQSTYGRTRENLHVTVLWPSTKPGKSLIKEAREFYLSKCISFTSIYRPLVDMDQQRNHHWQITTTRPSRPVSTVVLDDQQKADLLHDMNEFLHPKTATWYAHRGIPHRRGYLFSGPPGTGKSSMSFALAGVFGLPIFCLSLSDSSMTEEHMKTLLNMISRRCIVLLEDIDSAGVSRQRPPRDDKEKPSEERTPSGDLQRPGGSKISLSGLLNAIDGVAAAEGRVLVMTTNYRDQLDEALVRPGRVDMTILFKRASKEQMKELFVRMYSANAKIDNRHLTKLSDILPKSRSNVGDMDGGSVQSKHTANENSTQECEPPSEDASLSQLADKFAEILPDGVFSPAQIQGFLLTRKKDPAKAVQDVTGWRDDQLAKEETKQ